MSCLNFAVLLEVRRLAPAAYHHTHNRTTDPDGANDHGQEHYVFSILGSELFKPFPHFHDVKALTARLALCSIALRISRLLDIIFFFVIFIGFVWHICASFKSESRMNLRIYFRIAFAAQEFSSGIDLYSSVAARETLLRLKLVGPTALARVPAVFARIST